MWDSEVTDQNVGQMGECGVLMLHENITRDTAVSSQNPGVVSTGRGVMEIYVGDSL